MDAVSLKTMTREELLAASAVQRTTINEAQRKLAVIDREILARSERAHFKVLSTLQPPQDPDDDPHPHEAGPEQPG